MRISSWGPLAQDVLYVLASTVKNQRLIKCSANYKDGISYIYIKAVGHVGERPNTIVVKFDGTVKFTDVGGKGPSNSDIKEKFQGQILEGMSIEHTVGPEGLGGKPLAVPTTTSNPDFWDPILTKIVLDKIQGQLSKDRMTVGGSKKVQGPGGEFRDTTGPAKFEYFFTVLDEPNQVLLEYKIVGRATRDRGHKGVVLSIPKQKNIEPLETVSWSKDTTHVYPGLRVPGNVPEPRPEPPQPVRRTILNPMEENFRLNEQGTYVVINDENMPKTLSTLYTIFKSVPSFHEGSTGEAPLKLSGSFWQSFFKNDNLLANAVYDALKIAWNKRNRTPEEIQQIKERATERSDEVLRGIIRDNPPNSGDLSALDRGRMNRLTELPDKPTDPTSHVIPYVEKFSPGY